MARKIMIVGAGGMGREAAWTLERINEVSSAWDIIGFADDDPAKQSGSIDGYPLIGTVVQASHDHPDAAVFLAIGDNATRERLYRTLRGHDFPIIIDPSADVAPTTELRHGVFIGPHAVVSAGSELGKFTIVNARAGVGHDCSLGDFSLVSAGATISGHTVLGEHVFVGCNACTLPKAKVGARAKISAGAAVNDVPEGEVR